ncbi:hypothetical protein BaRGS_00029543 [Batillaria attramentaria]|uniref:Uncharacterized protein n=1 Tax=Batillaria attramentaria TaxID=370345 RepID=A0ABD0JWS3_9CAEN
MWPEQVARRGAGNSTNCSYSQRRLEIFDQGKARSVSSHSTTCWPSQRREMERMLSAWLAVAWRAAHTRLLSASLPPPASFSTPAGQRVIDIPSCLYVSTTSWLSLTFVSVYRTRPQRLTGDVCV